MYGNTVCLQKGQQFRHRIVNAWMKEKCVGDEKWMTMCEVVDAEL